jgi:hypothetical protein
LPENEIDEAIQLFGMMRMRKIVYKFIQMNGGLDLMLPSKESPQKRVAEEINPLGNTSFANRCQNHILFCKEVL